jgi:hypothetical protein
MKVMKTTLLMGALMGVILIIGQASPDSGLTMNRCDVCGAASNGSPGCGKCASGDR